MGKNTALFSKSVQYFKHNETFVNYCFSLKDISYRIYYIKNFQCTYRGIQNYSFVLCSMKKKCFDVSLKMLLYYKLKEIDMNLSCALKHGFYKIWYAKLSSFIYRVITGHKFIKLRTLLSTFYYSNKIPVINTDEIILISTKLFE